jgi:hypothetical protein
MDSEERRARRLAEIRAQRGTQERARQIEDLEAHRRIEPPPRDRTVRVRRTTSAPKPRTSGKTAGTSFFGHPWAEWHQMVDVGRTFLIGKAEAGTTTTAEDLWQVVGDTLGLTLGDPTLPMPFLLRDITNREKDDSGLVLAALVVDDDGAPLPAFDDQHPRPSKWSAHVESLYAYYGEN